MRLIFIIISITILFLTSCKEKDKPTFFELENAIDIARTEVVVFSREEVMERIPNIKRYDIPALVDEKGTVYPYQLDDLDQDKEWDEMAVAINFDALEKKKVRFIAFAKALKPMFPETTDVHLGVGNVKPYAREVQKYVRTIDPRESDTIFLQMEGPAWENDKVGFRMYFDPRNGIDIFGKTTDQLVLKDQGLTTNYHEQSDWGMDVLKVGNSLGAGSLAIKYKDSLHRLKGVYGARYEVLADGPVRSIFTINYLDEPIGDERINVVHTISIEKGDWFYKSDVALHGKTDGMELVTGIVDLKENTHELVASKEGNYILLSHGLQSENNDHLGMSIITTGQQSILNEAPTEGTGITNTHLLHLGDQQNHRFYFMSGWEASDERFATLNDFKQEVMNSASKIYNPIIIK